MAKLTHEEVSSAMSGLKNLSGKDMAGVDLSNSDLGGANLFKANFC